MFQWRLPKQAIAAQLAVVFFWRYSSCRFSCCFHRHDYQITSMHQYCSVFALLFQSGLLCVESMPLPGGLACSGIRRSESFLRERAPGTPLDKSEPNKCQGSCWSLWMAAIILILLTGILAGLTLAVMSTDVTRLRVWMNTGGQKQRSVLDLCLSGYETYGY